MVFPSRVVPARTEAEVTQGIGSNILEQAAASNLIGLLAQLIDVRTYATEMFRELHKETKETVYRINNVRNRVKSLEGVVPSFEDLCHQSCPQNFYNCVSGDKIVMKSQADLGLFVASKRPEEVKRRRADCRQVPNLNELNRFSEALDVRPEDQPLNCLKKYSYPRYFLDRWKDEQIRKMEVIMQQKLRKKELRDARRAERRKHRNSKKNKKTEDLYRWVTDDITGERIQVVASKGKGLKENTSLTSRKKGNKKTCVINTGSANDGFEQEEFAEPQVSNQTQWKPSVRPVEQQPINTAPPVFHQPSPHQQPSPPTFHQQSPPQHHHRQAPPPQTYRPQRPTNSGPPSAPKVMQPPPAPTMFTAPSTPPPQPTPSLQMPEFMNQYATMKKVGIGEHGIKQKMAINGDDPSLYDQWLADGATGQPVAASGTTSRPKKQGGILGAIKKRPTLKHTERVCMCVWGGVQARPTSSGPAFLASIRKGGKSGLKTVERHGPKQERQLNPFEQAMQQIKQGKFKEKLNSVETNTNAGRKQQEEEDGFLMNKLLDMRGMLEVSDSEDSDSEEWSDSD